MRKRAIQAQWGEITFFSKLSNFQNHIPKTAKKILYQSTPGYEASYSKVPIIRTGMYASSALHSYVLPNWPYVRYV